MLRTTHRSLTAAVGGVALLTMLVGCSAPAAEHDTGGDSRVATLETGSPAPTASVDPLFATYGEPVRERLDMTDEEGEAAWRPRDRCIDDHTSAPQSTSEEGDDTSGSSSAAVDTDSSAEAEAICSRLAPLPPWELDAQNPDALRFVQTVVDCLRGHGVREVEIGEADQFGRIAVALGGESNDSASISLGMQHIDACMATASEGVAP